MPTILETLLTGLDAITDEQRRTESVYLAGELQSQMEALHLDTVNFPHGSMEYIHEAQRRVCLVITKLFYNTASSTWRTSWAQAIADAITTGSVDPEAIDDRVAALLVAGTGISIDYDDMLGTITITNTGSAPTLDHGKIWIGDVSDVPTAYDVSGDITMDDVGVTSIGTNKVALSMLAQIGHYKMLGRFSASTGNVEEVSASDLKTILSLDNVENTALSTWHGSSNLDTAGTFAVGTWEADPIADAYIDSTLTGKTYNGLTLIADAVGFTISGGTTSKSLTVHLDAVVSGTNTGDQTITLTGDVTGSGTGSFATTITANAVLNSMFRQSSGLSIVGRSANTTGDVADITGTDGQVLRVAGTVLGFGTIATAGIANNAVTLGKIASIADQTILGNNTGGAASPVALTASQTKTILSLNLVENTALSTWVGSTNITTAGTFTTGVWNASVIPVLYGGTGVTTSTGSGDVVLSTSPTLTTAVLGSSTATTQAPGDSSTKLATTAYVDAAVFAEGIAKETCKYVTIAALPTVIYSNGSSGVGATLTGFAFGALSLDSTTPSVGDRALIRNQVSDFQNGIYTVTVVGDVSTAFVLTRAIDFNQSIDIRTGSWLFVSSGSTFAGTQLTYTGIDNPIMGTTSITFVQTNGPGYITGGNGITVTGTSVAIDTSVTVDKTTVQTLTNKTLTSPTFTTPVLGTPSSGNLANCTAYPASALAGATLASGVTASSLTSVGTLATLTVTATIVGSVNGNSATATALQTARNINGVSFDGTAAITVTAAAGTLSGATLASGVTASSLTSLGTLAANLIFTDATYDIGASGATRPRDFFLSRNATVGGTLAVTSTTAHTGNVAIGGAAQTDRALFVTTSNQTSTDQRAATFLITGASDATSTIYGVRSTATTAAASFTCGVVAAFYVLKQVKGAGSTITNHYGLYMEDIDQGATSHAIYTNAGLVRFGGAVTAASTLTSTGLATFNGGISVTSTASSFYENGNFTGTLTGCTTSPTTTFNWERHGNLVHIYSAAAVTGTSNTTACTITGMSAAIKPTTQQDVKISFVEDNGTVYLNGIARIGTNGTITLIFSANGATDAMTATFTNSGVKGLSRMIQLTYIISP